MRRFIVACSFALALVVPASIAAHPHEVTKGNGEKVTIANGQNHPRPVLDKEAGLWMLCEGIEEPANSGPAGYGLETAHHGPDQGTPGKGDGCYAIADHPAEPETDRNPAIN